MHESEDTDNPDRISTATIVRCFLALICSHAGAPYAAARVTIRYLLEGSIEPVYAGIAGVAIISGAALSFRRMIDQPLARRRLYAGSAIVLWLVMSFVQLAVASDSVIPRLLLTVLWAVGTFWVMWLVWGLSFFRTQGFVIGLAMAALGAGAFWSLIDITGLTGDARVEFAWRKADSPVATQQPENRQTVSDVGAIVWPGYLGPHGTAAVEDLTPGTDWNASPPRELWRSPCGRGWSSFAATQTTLYGQEQINREDCVVARDLTTGEVIWSVSENRPGFRSGLGGDGPRATPTLHAVTDDDGTVHPVVLAVGPTGLVTCLNASDGAAIWTTDLAELFPGENLVHGVCGSPLVVDNLVVVCPPAPDGPCLAALSLQDGTLVWKCDSDWRASYTSPQLLKICDHLHIVIHASPGAIAVSPLDGRVLWQYEFSNEWDNNATQPVQLQNEPNDILIATGYRGGAVRLSIREAQNAALQVTEVWKTTSTLKTKFCGVFLFGEVAVGLDNGILCAVDTGTGRRLWKKGRFGHGQMLKVGPYLIVVEEQGRVHLLRPDALGFTKLGTSEALDRKTWNCPILAGDRLIVRNDQEIVCLRLPTVVHSDSQSR